MPVVICPTIDAFENHGYRSQMERVEPFAPRIHIDLMDGVFAPTKSPPISEIWWNENKQVDVHLMYQNPMQPLAALIKLKPSMVIVHFEAEANHQLIASQLKAAGIKAGLAILPATQLINIDNIIADFDQLLIFAGHLGYQGGEADLSQLDKVRLAKASYPELEIAWDGGINELNIDTLVKAGVEVLNSGGYIQNAPNPAKAYATLKEAIRG